MNARSHMYMCLTAKMVVEGKGGERGEKRKENKNEEKRVWKWRMGDTFI